MGLSDFFSILAYALILIVFYLLFKISIGDVSLRLATKSTTIENSVSLLSILRTPVKIENEQMSIAQLIALSKFDSKKKDIVKQKLLEIIDDAYGTSMCTIICIDENKIKGSGCEALDPLGTFVTYQCSSNKITIPSYDLSSIEISLETNPQAENLQPRP